MYYYNLKRYYAFGTRINKDRALSLIDKFFGIRKEETAGVSPQVFFTEDELLLSLENPERLYLFSELTDGTRATLLDNLLMRDAPVQKVDMPELMTIRNKLRNKLVKNRNLAQLKEL